MARSKEGTGRLLLTMAVFLMIGAPFAAVAWEQLSHMLSGNLTGRGLLLMAGSLAIFAGIAWILQRWISRVQTR